MWNNQTYCQEYDFSLTYQHEASTQSDSSNFAEKRSRRGRGRGIRGTYKPRNRNKQDDKLTTKKEEYSGVYINPKILVQLGYTTYPIESNKQNQTNTNNSDGKQLEITSETYQANTSSSSSSNSYQNKILNGAEALLELDCQENLFSKESDDNFTLSAYYTS